jgi:redox-sensitive bicupin YhaK (pirin superfamily)
MKSVLHKADTRGKADYGWLKSYHSFSFSNYHNPERMHFGVLRVLNDDTVAGGMGFDQHPHQNMEIISIPLEGDLEHKDSIGSTTVIHAGDVQVMSAGTGVYHSEYNHSKEKEVKFLQIWVIPNTEGVAPRYDQVTLEELRFPNQWYQILSPNRNEKGVWIHQDAWFHMGEFEAGLEVEYAPKRNGNGLYLFVLAGNIEVAEHALSARDGLGMWDVKLFTLRATTNSKLLLMDIPMSI